MTGNDVTKYLLAMLNSKLLGNVFKKFYGTELSGKATRYKKIYIEQLPIPKIEKKGQKPYVNLVNKILSLRSSKDFETSKPKQNAIKQFQEEIDQMVYNLFGLTDKEVQIIEKGSSGELDSAEEQLA